MRRISLLGIVLLSSLPSAACGGGSGHGCSGSVTASLNGVIAAGPAAPGGAKRGVALPPQSRAVLSVGGTVTWKAEKTGTVIDNKKASGDLPPPVTTTTAEATTTTTGVNFSRTTVPATLPPARTPEQVGRPFTATTKIGTQTLTVKGTIVGPPAPCHGIGSWSVASPDNSQAGGGSWSF